MPVLNPDPYIREAVWIANTKLDGDTIDVRIDLGFSVWVEERLRLKDVWAKEKEGLKIVEAWFAKHGPACRVQTFKNSMGNRVVTFGRFVAEVTAQDGESSLNDHLRARLDPGGIGFDPSEPR